MTDARRAAWEILQAVRDGQLFEAARDRVLPGLSQRDGRLAQEIAAGVLRQRRALDAPLRRVLRRRWRTTRPELLDLLRIGTYQLRYLTRVPAHAAVQSTVEAAKPLGPKPAGFVNAVLRRLLAGEEEPGPPEPDDVAAALGRRHSHPDWLVRRWLARYGRPATEALLVHDNAVPPLIIQPARWTREQLLEALKRAGVECGDASGGPGIKVGSRRPAELPGFGEGGFIVQGPGQARLLAHAAVPSGVLVWDCCAAPGGKAVALGARGPVLASDRGPGRLARLRTTVRRAAPAVRVFVADARRPPLADRSLEVVWLDAPCTATGTLARHPDARWRLSERRMAGLCRLQEALLDAVSPLIRSSGILVYSTCSLEPEENAQQVDAFLSRHPDWRRDRDDLSILATETGSDGGYLAVLRRS